MLVVGGQQNHVLCWEFLSARQATRKTFSPYPFIWSLEIKVPPPDSTSISVCSLVDVNSGSTLWLYTSRFDFVGVHRRTQTMLWNKGFYSTANFDVQKINQFATRSDSDCTVRSCCAAHTRRASLTGAFCASLPPRRLSPTSLGDQPAHRN